MAAVLLAADTRREYDDLWWSVYAPVLFGVLAVVLLAIVYAVWRAGRRAAPRRTRSATNVEIGGALVIGVLVALLFAGTYRTEQRVDRVTSPGALELDVTAFQWGWRFVYPGGVSVAGTDRKNPTLVVPQGRTVRVELDARDVVHAFWVPAIRYKKDAFPGSTNTFELVFAETGRFPGRCAEFCGLRHTDMGFEVLVLAPAEFDAWLEARA
jgi:cytochrome c oxidase subunit 2